jgi:hypothetical protein
MRNRSSNCRPFQQTDDEERPNTQRDTLEDFIADVVAPGSLVHTDGKQEYGQMERLGYIHQHV